MRVLITGANGFIGKNLRVRLAENKKYEVVTYTREDSPDTLEAMISGVDAIFHLAGANRPANADEFTQINLNLTEQLCHVLRQRNVNARIIYASSVQAELDNPYGVSKLAAENVLTDYSRSTGCSVSIYRLPNVFGKWCRPDYNSVVATFCDRIANNKGIDIQDPHAMLNLVYIDDVISSFLETLDNPGSGFHRVDLTGSYQLSVGQLADILFGFRDSRNNLNAGRVGAGLARALYATYLSYLRPDNFSYPLVSHNDSRGKFVEFLKTPESGQFSFLTAGPGITRGCHYHHTKNEKFLVVQGEASFRFRHLITGESSEIRTNAESPIVVETVPGWVHDITNCGGGELIVLLWANEVFDSEMPDTVGASIDE
jgi:UDP-2-acetamido-2,6-beta-L-arabino-hexul-4-ose reductase